MRVFSSKFLTFTQKKIIIYRNQNKEEIKMFLLHTHAEGEMAHWFEEIFLHGLFDTLKLIPFLFLTYLLMEFIDHKAGDKDEEFVKHAGAFAPLVGGALGAIPQCGFSAAAANFFAGHVVSMGTIVAVFLATTDEMIPILVSAQISVGTIALVVLYMTAVAIIVGLGVDLVLKLLKHRRETIKVDVVHDDEEDCHCHGNKGVIHSALHHTATISVFVLIVTLAVNALVFFVGEENLGAILYNRPVISHLIASIFGLIPNCAVSVALTSLCTKGVVSAGTMMSGLFANAGVGLLVLFKLNKKTKENLIILAIMLTVGIVFGFIGDLIFPAAFFR